MLTLCEKKEDNLVAVTCAGGVYPSSQMSVRRIQYGGRKPANKVNGGHSLNNWWSKSEAHAVVEAGGPIQSNVPGTWSGGRSTNALPLSTTKNITLESQRGRESKITVPASHGRFVYFA